MLCLFGSVYLVVLLKGQSSMAVMHEGVRFTSQGATQLAIASCKVIYTAKCENHRNAAFAKTCLQSNYCQLVFHKSQDAACSSTSWALVPELSLRPVSAPALMSALQTCTRKHSRDTLYMCMLVVESKLCDRPASADAIRDITHAKADTRQDRARTHRFVL
jgi:hypothetical protein